MGSYWQVKHACVVSALAPRHTGVCLCDTAWCLVRVVCDARGVCGTGSVGCGSCAVCLYALSVVCRSYVSHGEAWGGTQQEVRVTAGDVLCDSAVEQIVNLNL